VGALVRDGCHPLPGRARIGTLTGSSLRAAALATDRMQRLDLGRQGQQRLLAERFADDLQTHRQPSGSSPHGTDATEDR